MGTKQFYQKEYFDLVFLGKYYRWLASKPSPAKGARSPITGEQYGRYRISEPVNNAHQAGYKAMAKTFFKEARNLRILNRAGNPA
jgi:hypothetical protein